MRPYTECRGYRSSAAPRLELIHRGALQYLREIRLVKTPYNAVTSAVLGGPFSLTEFLFAS
jgi:hypothetical protein